MSSVAVSRCADERAAGTGRSARTPLIVIDGTGLDTLHVGNGQYRYMVDLVGELARRTSDFRYLLLGSRPQAPAELADVFAAPGCRWRYRPIPRWERRGRMYVNHVRYSRVLLGERASLLHVLHGAIPVLAPCPVVATKYDLMYELFPEYDAAVRTREYRMLRWTICNLARRVICISESTARDVQRLWGVDRARIDVVPLGTRLTSGAHATRTASSDTARGLTILSPFNLEPRKNLARLLEATAMLRDRLPKVRLVLFGHAAVTPEREEHYETLVRCLRLETVVCRLGHISDGELHDWYHRTSAFVFPSLYEGFGLPVLEAMAAGAFVVAGNAGATAEVVADAGCLVDTGDARALADAIVAVVDRPELVRRLRIAARARALTFSTARTAELTEYSYATALGSSARSNDRR